MASLRWFQGKQLVSFLRGGDYAHAGEEEAIIKVMSKFRKNSAQSILDVGCGQGGTAHFMQQQGWGKVTGIDIEEKSIEYAKKTYPEVEFHTADVIQVPSILEHRTFDIICLYNSFYAFADQEEALRALHKLAHNDTQMVIYDYTGSYEETNPPFMPVQPKSFAKMLKNADWKLIETIDVSKEYKNWYFMLLEKMKSQKLQIIQKFSEDLYYKALHRYEDIYNYLVDGKMGGGIFYITVQ